MCSGRAKTQLIRMTEDFVEITCIPRLAASSSSRLWSSSLRVTYLRLILSPHFTFPFFSSSFTSSPSSRPQRAAHSTPLPRHRPQPPALSLSRLSSAVLRSGSGWARSVVLVALAWGALSALEQLIGRGHARRGREGTHFSRPQPASKTTADCDR